MAIKPNEKSWDNHHFTYFRWHSVMFSISLEIYGICDQLRYILSFYLCGHLLRIHRCRDYIASLAPGRLGVNNKILQVWHPIAPFIFIKVNDFSACRRRGIYNSRVLLIDQRCIVPHTCEQASSIQEILRQTYILTKACFVILVDHADNRRCWTLFSSRSLFLCFQSFSLYV